MYCYLQDILLSLKTKSKVQKCVWTTFFVYFFKEKKIYIYVCLSNEEASGRRENEQLGKIGNFFYSITFYIFSILNHILLKVIEIKLKKLSKTHE